MNRHGAWRRLHATLGAPGLMIGLFSILSFGFGLVVFVREYDRLRESGRETLRPALAVWVKRAPVHYLGWTLGDYVDRWRHAPPAEREARLRDVRQALDVLGDPNRQSPLIEILALDLAPRGGSPLTGWRARSAGPMSPSDQIESVPVASAGPGPPLALTIRYRLAPEVERVAVELETSYRRLLLAILGLSGYSLLCLGYMILHVQALRDRVARESAQAATLDLADRTCHELGNVAFVLANERRNLADHLALVERFIAESPDALATAARRAGFDPSQNERLLEALRREYGGRGIDPDVELRGGVAIAADVCRQIAVCSRYISLTVRELDAYLKQSTLPVATEPVGVADCLDDALALLGPSLEAANAEVDRPPDEALAGLRVIADRRLLVHALVNVLKNALEAASAAGLEARLTLAVQTEGALVWVEVADRGPGIAPEELARVFDFGYSTKGSGRGRGLAIVRDSIRSQRGQVHIRSTPGQGTTVRIGLPRDSVS